MFRLLSVFCVFLLTHNRIRTNKEGGTFSWVQGRKIHKYGPGHSQSYDSMYFQVRGIHKVRGIY
jgi:hypothetical protein